MKKLLLIFLLLIPIYIILYKIYIPRVNAFGCFDDCFNIVAGYFISKGKILYEQIPYNHNPLMAYVSFFIQSISSPQNIFELILRHRQFILLFGFFVNLLILFRFGIPALGFVLFFEFSKFYIFGDRFLAESIVVYPIVYLFALSWNKLKNNKIYNVEYILSAVLVWFIIFAREPFVPLAIFLFFSILFGKPFNTYKKLSISIFFILSAVTLLLMPLKEYIYDVFYINFSGVFAYEANSSDLFGQGFIKIFFYPFYILFGGEWNLFRTFISLIDSVFIMLIFTLLFKRKFKLLIFLFLILGLSNIRYSPPGLVFYSTFHMVPWYGLFIMSTFLILFDEYKVNKKFTILPFLLLFISFTLLFSQQSFIREKINSHEEFITNYGNYLQVGEVIKILSRSSDTLFVDGFDELIYWQADRPSSYRYNWYTSFMPNFAKFSDARLEMFAKNPPDFYYGSCPKEKNLSRLMPASARNQYQQLYSQDDPTCIYVKKIKIPEISKKQWKRAKEFLFDQPQ